MWRSLHIVYYGDLTESTYTVKGESVTKEEYERSVAFQNEKPDPDWKEFK